MAGTSGLGTYGNEPSVSSKSSHRTDATGPSEVEDLERFTPKMSGEMSESTLLSDSVSTESSVSCRICKYNAGDNLVPSPCHCKGSMGWVHVACLEEWLTGSTRDSCELCSCPFTVVRTPKYGYLQSIWIFLKTRISVFRLLRDFFFLVVSLINTCILTYMWLAYIFRDLLVVMDEKSYLKQQSEGNQRYLTTPLRTFIYSFVFTLCLVFVSLNTVDDFRRIFYYYFLPWYHWWKASVEPNLQQVSNIGVTTVVAKGAAAPTIAPQTGGGGVPKEMIK